MFKKEGNEAIDTKKVNELVSFSKKFVQIAYILLIILGFYAITILLKEWRIIPFITTILNILAPLFIGLLIAWLFDPAVRFFKKKGFRRGIGAAIVYVIFIGILAIIIGMILPLLTEQINDFVSTIPQIINTVRGWIDGVFERLGNIEGFNANEIEQELFLHIENYGNELTRTLPTIIVNTVTSLFSAIGTILVGLIIGFYLLISFDSVDDLFEFLPKRLHNDSRNLAHAINSSFRHFVQGALLDSSLIFIVSSLSLGLVGLKAPLLFGLFCGLTNVIPYAGPYIGGFPAVIVGFSQGTTTGILVLLVIAIIQFIEGNFFQPVIMSKTTKLHPVTIMLGLLLFGHYLGIFGMLVSTPIIAACKAVFLYFDDKYDLLNFN